MNIHFLLVEPIYVKMHGQGKTVEAFYNYIEQQIEQIFEQNCATICMESTAIASEFEDHLRRLNLKFRVILIKITAPLELCRERVMNRDKANHMPVTPEQLDQWNQAAAAVELAWDECIDNTGPATGDEVAAVIQRVLG